MRDALLALDGGAVAQLTDTEEAFETLLNKPLMQYAKEVGAARVHGAQVWVSAARVLPITPQRTQPGW